MVAKQVSRQYHAKEPMLIKYLPEVQNFSSCFLSFKVEHIPREQNFIDDLLSKLSTSKVVRFNRIVIQETITSSSIEEDKSYFVDLTPEFSWTSHILRYLQYVKLPLNEG